MKQLRKDLESESLLHLESTIARLNHAQITGKSFGAIYYGTGLATQKSISAGVPFDILIMILMAELLRRQFRLTQTFHHIADTHALSNSFCSKNDVELSGLEYKAVLSNIVRVLGIPLVVKLSSEFDGSSGYCELLEKVHTQKSEYVRRELADILWYRKRYRVRLKLGWLIQDEKSGTGFDEKLFDDEFLSQCDERMSFAYTLPGRTFDRNRLRVPPYIAIPGESRILFKKGENVRLKYVEADSGQFPGRTTTGMVQHLFAIMRLWDKLSLTPVPENDDVLKRVQTVIDLVCG